uniref:Biopolymer transporter ExbD n=1 Tax=Schlesneria paludicola TaxID=360056 RepID=A0A7C4LMD8_9PLAN
MAVRFRCPHCNALLSITSRQIGTTVPCPSCWNDVLVPEQDLAEAVPAAADEESAEAHDGASSVAQSARPARVGVPVAAADRPLEDWESEEGEAEPSFKLPKRRGEEEEMDLTPMVDVVFQLLIFFMVTASFSLQKSMSAPTPEQEKKGVAQSLQTPEDLQDLAVVVRIDNRSAVTVDDEPVGDLSDLADVLRTRMRKEQKSEMVVFAEGDALHRTVVAVIDAANAAGMQRIRLSSSPPPD